MDEWNYVDFVCEGEEIKLLYNIIKKLDDEELKTIEENQDTLWLGNVIYYMSGLKSDIIGYIIGYELHDDYLSMTIDAPGTTWTIFKSMLEKKYQSLKIYYLLQNDYFENYSSNDIDNKYFKGDYILVLDYEPETYSNLEDIVKAIKDKFDINVEPTEEAILEVSRSIPDKQCIFSKVRKVNDE